MIPVCPGTFRSFNRRRGSPSATAARTAQIELVAHGPVPRPRCARPELTVQAMQVTSGAVKSAIADLQAAARLEAEQWSADASTGSARSNGAAALHELLRACCAAHTALARGAAPQLEPLRSTLNGLNAVVNAQYNQVCDACTSLQDSLQEGRELLSRSSPYGFDSSIASAERILSHSHRLGYSSFAPLMGVDLLQTSLYLPPFPSTFNMQLSKLNNTAILVQSRKENDAQQAAAAAGDEAEVARQAGEEARSVRDAAAGTETEFKMPPMPKGWKPGDPIPMPPELPLAAVKLRPPPEPAVTGDQARAEDDGEVAEAPLILDLDTGINDDFLLNAEAVDSSSDDASDDMEEESD